MRRWIAPALFALIIGCGWKRDLAQGNAAAERGDWVEAVEHYRAASEANPDDKALDAKLADAIEQAIAGLVEQARAAHAGGQHDEALDLLDQAEGLAPRQLEVAMLREEVVGELAGQVRGALEDPDDPVGQAYERWVPFAERFPVHPETARLRDEISAALGASVAARVEAEEYGAAYRQLQSYQDRLPMDEELATVRSTWAASLASEASTAARRRQPATAWVAMALAASLSGSSEHQEQAASYQAAFAKAHGVVLGPRISSSDRAALGRIESRLAALFEHSAVRWAPGAPRATVGGSIRIADPTWEQSSKQTVAIHEYPGPEREHDNPAYLEAKADVESAEAAVSAAAKDEERALASRAAEQRSLQTMQEGLASVERSLEGVRAAFAAAEAEATKAQAALDEAVGANQSVTQLQEQRAGLETELTAAQDALETALADLEAAGASGEDVGAANAAVAEARRGVEDARATLEAAPKPTNLMRELARHVGTRAGQLAEKERALEEARAELEARQAPVQDQLDAVARIEARLVELDGALEAALEAQAEAQRQVEDAQAKLPEIPETIFGPTIERIEIPVQSHLRSCTMEIGIDLRPRGAVRVQESLRGRAETRDEERPAVEEHGLEADPLAFPESDAELQARVEVELAKQLRAQLEAQLSSLGRAHLEQGLAASDPEATLRELLLAAALLPADGDDPYAQPSDAAADEADAQQALWSALQERWGVVEKGWFPPLAAER